MLHRLFYLLFLALIPMNGLAARDEGYFVVIVNAKNPTDTVDRKFLQDTFFKRITRWPEDGIIQPVDQRPDSPIRRVFSEAVLSRSVMGVKSYWQQLIFSGTDVPPPELGDDEEVVRFVARTPGSIGYVSPAVHPGSSSALGVKAVTVR
jgi:ABC-type phosphate transport system substrate-binding protein